MRWSRRTWPDAADLLGTGKVDVGDRQFFALSRGLSDDFPLRAADERVAPEQGAIGVCVRVAIGGRGARCGGGLEADSVSG